MKIELLTNITIKTPIINFMNLPIQLDSVTWNPCLILGNNLVLSHLKKITSWISAYLYKSMDGKQYFKLRQQFDKNPGEYFYENNKLIYSNSQKKFLEIDLI